VYDVGSVDDEESVGFSTRGTEGFRSSWAVSSPGDGLRDNRVESGQDASNCRVRWPLWRKMTTSPRLNKTTLLTTWIRRCRRAGRMTSFPTIRCRARVLSPPLPRGVREDEEGDQGRRRPQPVGSRQRL